MTETLALPDHVRDFLAAPGRFVTLATLDPDGAPRQAIAWYRLDPDGRIVVNSAAGRRWPANLRRDPRCALAVADPASAYRFVALVGRVETIVDDQEIAQADIAGLARRYHAGDPAVESLIAQFREQRRVTFRIAAAGIHDHLEG